MPSSRDNVSAAMRRGRPPYPDLLTPREQEVLDLLRRGLTNQQIADRLGISLPGARYHVSEILSKLGVDSRQEAAAWSSVGARSRGRWLPAFLAEPLARLPVSSIGKGIGAGALGLAGIALALLAFGVISMSQRTSSPGYGDCTTGENAVDCPAGKLAYVQDGDVWAKQLPDGTPQRLTTDGRSFAPAWSPSGDWLLFQKRANDSTPECWLVRADGTDARGIDGGADCAWSPANDTFASVQSGALTVENADGSGRRELLQRPDAVVLRDVAFVWSPDGAWLAYSRQERPVNGPASAWDYAAVWRVRPDGSDALQLVTASAGMDRNAGGASTVGFIPMGFTPDVRGVLYAVDPVASDAGTESMELRVVTMDRFAGLDGRTAVPNAVPGLSSLP
jgi:DNA-binding CsgD family transcriptional regulator